jgi:hypothetical protein
MLGEREIITSILSREDRGIREREIVQSLDVVTWIIYRKLPILSNLFRCWRVPQVRIVSSESK